MVQCNPKHLASYQQFIDEVRTNGQLWGLRYCGEWLICYSDEFTDICVQPFWSSETAAKAHCTYEWENYRPVSISLKSFFETWANELSEEGVLIGINWDLECNGVEIEPMELLTCDDWQSLLF